MCQVSENPCCPYEHQELNDNVGALSEAIKAAWLDAIFIGSLEQAGKGPYLLSYNFTRPLSKLG